MRGPLGDRAAVENMMRFAERVRRHAPIKPTLHDEHSLAGTLWELAMIGEAATRASPELRSRHPEVPWTRIVSMRNILVHAYDRSDLRQGVGVGRDG